jgi:hypothetical protein
MAEASVKDVKDYFGMSSKEMMTEWKALDDKSKAEIKAGIGNGTLTY